MKKIHSYILFGIYIVLFFLIWNVATESRSHPLDEFPSEMFMHDFGIIIYFSNLATLIAHLAVTYFLFRFQIKSALISGLIETFLIVTQFVALCIVSFNITKLNNFINYIPFRVAIMIIIIGIQIYLIYTKSLEKIKKISKKAQRERLAKTIINKERVSITELIDLLNVRQATFERQLLDWAVDFSLKIDGDDIIITKETQDDFLDALDAKYIQWEKSVQKKTGNKI